MGSGEEGGGAGGGWGGGGRGWDVGGGGGGGGLSAGVYRSELSQDLKQPSNSAVTTFRDRLFRSGMEVPAVLPCS